MRIVGIASIEALIQAQGQGIIPTTDSIGGTIGLMDSMDEVSSDTLEYPIVLHQSKEILKLRLILLGVVLFLGILAVILFNGILRALFDAPVDYVLFRLVGWIAIGMMIYIMAAYLIKLQWSHITYGLMPNRIEVRSGVFSIQAQAHTLMQFNMVNVRQSWLGKRKNVGTLVLANSEGGADLELAYVDDPFTVRKMINDARRLSDADRMDHTNLGTY